MQPRGLDLLRKLRVWDRLAVGLLALATAGCVAALAAHALFGLASDRASPFGDWIVTGGSVCVAALVVLRALRVELDRSAWSVLSAGLLLYAIGTAIWSFWLQQLEQPPYPSISDALWLSLYPASYVALGLLLRARVRDFRPSLWLDGVIAALASASLAVAFIYDILVAGSTGTGAAVATNLAYPIADVLLIVFVVGSLALTGWRPGGALSLLGCGFVGLAAADALYLSQVTTGAFTPGGVANLMWAIGATLLAAAAWAAPGRPGSTTLDGSRVLALPFVFACAALAVLVVDRFEPVNPLSFLLALGAVLTGMVKTLLAFRELRELAGSRRQAVTDELTGLGNRRLFFTRLEEALSGGGSEDRLAVLLVDLDHFKELNDTLGHQAGDLFLSQLGPRLAGAMRTQDTVARLGGDEFAIVLPRADRAAALAASERVRSTLATPLPLDDINVRAAASIGIALRPDHAGDATSLLQHADVALYAAKARRSGVEIYEAGHDPHSRDRLALAAELRDALDRRELILHYQPVFNLNSWAFDQVEALARWQHPRRGLLPPAAFLSAAEHGGMSQELALTISEMALQQCAAWRREGIKVTVRVNVTSYNLADVGLPAHIGRLLSKWDLPPQALLLEITEGSIMAEPERVVDALGGLAELGVNVSLDDFGTGYSSLSWLKRLPVAELKIDRAFIAGMPTDPDDATIVRSIIDLARALQLETVAEGVEDQNTLEELTRLGCDHAQGFHLCRPLPASDFPAWAHKQHEPQGEPLTIPQHH